MNGLAGTGALVRLIVRRDRLRLTMWLGAFAVVSSAVAGNLAKLFPTPEARALLGTIGRNPAVLALVGPAFDTSTVGGITAWRLGGLGAALVALMSILSVVRHTRGEEEAGRRELLASAAVGRHAALFAAVLVTAAADLLLGLLVAAGLVAVGLPPGGAVAMGLSLCAAGWVFAAVAAVTAQLTESARAAAGLAGALLGIAMLARAVGDATGGGAAWLSWSSPIGWAQQVRPFAGERFGVLALSAVTAATLAGVALALSANRDLGAGVLGVRPGPAHASRSLQGAIGLAWRLQRGALIAWTASFAVAGAAVGFMARGAAEVIGGSVRIRVVIAALGGAGGLVDAFLAATLHVLGILASAYAVQAVLRLRTEELAGKSELVLAAAVSRARWASSHLVFAIVGPAVILATAGTAAGGVHGLAVGDVTGQLPRVLVAALAQLPAAWILAGLTLALFGLGARLAPVTWAVLGATVVIWQFGGFLPLGRLVRGASPFAHLPRMPGGDADVGSLVGMLVVAAALMVAGFVGLRRRDLG